MGCSGGNTQHRMLALPCGLADTRGTGWDIHRSLSLGTGRENSVVLSISLLLVSAFM